MGHTPLLNSDNAKIDRHNYSMLMFAHLKQKKGAFEVFILTPDEAHVGTDKELRDIKFLNNWCYSILIESCSRNATALMLAEALFDPLGRRRHLESNFVEIFRIQIH